MRSWRRAPVEAPGHRSLASSEASITPAWQATTTSCAGMGGGQRVQGRRHPVDEPGPALPARGDGLARVDVPVEGAEPVGELAPGQPVGLAGVELAQAALGDHRRGPVVRPSRADRRRQGRRQQLGGLDGPGQHAGIEGVGPGQLPGRRPGGRRNAFDLARGPGRSDPGSRAARRTRPTRCTPPRRGGPAPSGWPPAAAGGHGADAVGRAAWPRWTGRRPRTGRRTRRTRRSRQLADELLELAEGAALDHVVAVDGVLADDRVARVPVGRGARG